MVYDRYTSYVLTDHEISSGAKLASPLGSVGPEKPNQTQSQRITEAAKKNATEWSNTKKNKRLKGFLGDKTTWANVWLETWLTLTNYLGFMMVVGFGVTAQVLLNYKRVVRNRDFRLRWEKSDIWFQPTIIAVSIYLRGIVMMGEMLTLTAWCPLFNLQDLIHDGLGCSPQTRIQ